MQNDKAKFKSESKGRIYKFALDVMGSKEMKHFCILNCNFNFLSLIFDIC